MELFLVKKIKDNIVECFLFTVYIHFYLMIWFLQHQLDFVVYKDILFKSLVSLLVKQFSAYSANSLEKLPEISQSSMPA